MNKFVKYFIFFLILANIINGLPLNGQDVEKETNLNRIVGGQEASDRYAPHMVALLVGDQFVVMICGASIVSLRHVLTAAHCTHAVLNWKYEVDPPLLPTFRGIIGSNEHTSTENVISFAHYINHPNWNQTTFKNDVGILFPSRNIQLNDRIAVIPLKTSWIDGGVDCYVAGWGGDENFNIPERLQLLYVRTLGGQECIDAVIAASEQLGAGAPPVDPAVEICTLHSPGHGMCNGDSGSALVTAASRQQIGIVSWGYPCAVGAPDVFVRISGVIDFLRPYIDN